MPVFRTDLYASTLVRVRRVTCRPEHAGPGGVEWPETDRIVLPVQGVFVQHLSRRSEVLADPTRVLLFAEGRPSRVSHPSAIGDVCLVLEFTAAPGRQVAETVAGASCLGDRRLRPDAPLPPGALALRALLLRRLTSGRADAVEVEESGMALLAAALRAASAGNETRAARRPHTRSRRREQAGTVRELLLSDPARNWTLLELSREAYTTPYHLARVFRSEAGVSVHRYLLHVRLACALDLLLDTDRSLGWIAHEVGFATHSHFTSTFARMIGCAPSALRRSATGAGIRETRRILIDAPARAR